MQYSYLLNLATLHWFLYFGVTDALEMPKHTVNSPLPPGKMHLYPGGFRGCQRVSEGHIQRVPGCPKPATMDTRLSTPSPQDTCLC